MEWKLDHVHIVSGDVEVMVGYFERVFGGEKVAYNPDLKGSANAIVHLGDLRLYIRGIRPGEKPDAIAPNVVQGVDHFGFTVEDVEKTAEWLRARGAEFSMEPAAVGMGGRTIAFVRGPENIAIEIVGPFVGL